MIIKNSKLNCFKYFFDLQYDLHVTKVTVSEFCPVFRSVHSEQELLVLNKFQRPF